MSIKGITLVLFGEIAEMKQEPPTPGAEFMMAIAGPLAMGNVHHTEDAITPPRRFPLMGPCKPATGPRLGASAKPL